VAELAVPAAHWVQDVDAVPEYVPVPHVEHVLAPAAL